MEIKINLEDNLTQKLNHIQKNIKNLKPLFNQIGYTLIDIVEENFDDESFLGKKWELTYRCGKKKKKKQT